MLINNLLFIGSLMPETVERLEIINRSESVEVEHRFLMSRRMSDKFIKQMPNIKILTFNDGEFMDIDCLSAFKKLEIFMTKEKPSIETPETINLFVVHNEHYDSGVYKVSEKELARV